MSQVVVDGELAPSARPSQRDIRPQPAATGQCTEAKHRQSVLFVHCKAHVERAGSAHFLHS